MTPEKDAPFNAPVLVDPLGRPARTRDTDRCPQCRALKDTRIASGGFGQPSTLCGRCGYDFHQPWQDKE